ncbi:hypothetical protein DL96DRAFT_1453878, partial [Flagelloscypha sp. PMI_526]
CVLCGPGGVGKTQMGLKFTQLSQNRFTDIFFLDASDINALHNDFKKIAVANSAGSTVKDALDYLSSRRDHLQLFLDNTDDPAVALRPVVSWSHGNILITTRNAAAPAHASDHCLHAHSLNMDESVTLFMHRL